MDLGAWLGEVGTGEVEVLRKVEEILMDVGSWWNSIEETVEEYDMASKHKELYLRAASPQRRWSSWFDEDSDKD